MAEVPSQALDRGVALVTINLPQAANALSRADRAAFSDCLERADADEAVGAIIVTAAGDRAFSAGPDLRELGCDEPALREVATGDPRLNPAAAVERCRKPVIAAIDGVCVRGALEMALACGMLVASATARFADSHAKVGLMPVWGLSQRLSRLIGPNRARKVSLTGAWIDADTAAQWGLVNRVVPTDDPIATAAEMARAVAGNILHAVVAAKALINDGFDMPLGAGLSHERTVGATFTRTGTPAMLEERRRALIGK